MKMFKSLLAIALLDLLKAANICSKNYLNSNSGPISFSCDPFAS
jgi:hypothetical protein